MEDLVHKTDTDVDFIASRLKSRRLLQVIVATMIGLAISGAINLIEGDWTNLNATAGSCSQLPIMVAV
jgi:hypothetical protein